MGVYYRYCGRARTDTLRVTRENMNRYLNDIYFNPEHEASFGGVEKLYKFVREDGRYRLSRKQIREWLEGIDTYTLHKPARRRFSRSRVIVGGMDDQWQMDLVDMSALSRYNSGYRYLLTCIDILSKFAWVVPIKDKRGKSLVSALKIIFKTQRSPLKIQTDKGTEFTNRIFQTFLKEKDIEFFTTENETKASVVERFNRTLKEKMWKYFTHSNTLKYTRILPKLLRAYNNAHHRSIKTKPVLVTKKNEGIIWQRLYGDQSWALRKQNRPRYEKGERVRISKMKRTFEKGYLPNWTEEVYTVSGRKHRDLPVYHLTDDNNEQLKGTFYEPELQRVRKDKADKYRVEKILRRRKRGGKTEYFVKFLGYPDTFNAWVDNIDKTYRN